MGVEVTAAGPAAIAFGVDMGGTLVRVAAVAVRKDAAASVMSSRRAFTCELQNLDVLLTWLADKMSDIRREIGKTNDAVALGVALAGLIDQDQGVVTRSISLPWLEKARLREALQSRLALNVALLTDADAAAWGEYQACDAKPARFAHVRLGTGVALGLVIEGRLTPVEPGRKAHAQVLVVEHGAIARPCSCGLTGCLETIASGRALSNGVDVRPGSLLADAVAMPYHAEGAQEDALDRAAKGVMVAIGNLVREYAVTHVCLGGGVFTRWPRLRTQIQQIRGLRHDLSQAGAIVTRATQGDDAGVIGAALLAADRVGLPALRGK